jgi:hypothetical protein
MRKTIGQLQREALEEEMPAQIDSGGIEILAHTSAEEIRGGDRPYVPMIYESQTKRQHFRLNSFLEKLGL